ncbi:MAG TPA: CBS domain-containing protein [Terriglobales bacterium]|nr:CBS domain-containing protein [Terriglobales bacterium]
MKVRELMSTGITTAELGTSLEEIATIMRHEDIGAVPIVDDDELVGIVTDRDIVVRCVAEGGDPGESTAEDILTEGLVTVSPDADLLEAEDMMSRHGIRRLPVVREGRLVGMISLGDISVKSRDTRGKASVLEGVSLGVNLKGQAAHRSGTEPGDGDRSAEDRRPKVVPMEPSEKTRTPRNSRQKSG